MGGDEDPRGRPHRSVVSIHAPAWGATEDPRGRSHRSAVSIHAPAWGATRNKRGGVSMEIGFNPRPRMGGDLCDQVLHPTDRVSIHAPAWGATNLTGAEGSPFPVSIHAPAWGATYAGTIRLRKEICFNPRPRMGGDLQQYFDRRRELIVSIHAPAWGATLIIATNKRYHKFQSTPPHGGRLLIGQILLRLRKRFNPRPRMGGDQKAGSRNDI